MEALRHLREQRVGGPMKRTITVTLTRREAESLLSAAANGFDGGAYFVDYDGHDSGYGGTLALNAYCRAVERIRRKLNRSPHHG